MRAMFCDLSSAFDKLDVEDRALLRLLHDAQSKENGELPTQQELCEWWAQGRDVQPATVRKRYNRLVKRLAELMSNAALMRAPAEPVGSRRKMSNAAAQATTRRQEG